MLIAIDSNIFISALGANQLHHDLASKLLLNISEGKNVSIASSITYGEVLSINSKDKSRLSLESFFKFIKNISTIPADDDICRLAALYRAKNGLKLPDAIHVATAITCKADVFISNDLKLTNSMKNHFNCMTLSQWSKFNKSKTL
jgi:predicted nucleic acid-binding protein